MPIRFSDFEHNQSLEASSLGQDNQAVLADVLGYSAEKISDLAEGKLFSLTVILVTRDLVESHYPLQFIKTFMLQNSIGLLGYKKQT